jgi:hypothetical protein
MRGIGRWVILHSPKQAEQKGSSAGSSLHWLIRSSSGCLMLGKMGWLTDNRERVKIRLRDVVDWRQTITNPPYVETTLDEWKIVVRPKDGDIQTCRTVQVFILSNNSSDEDFYECARQEVLP